MANSKIKIVTLALILTIFLNIGISFAEENYSNDYEKIYSSLEEADFDYIFGIDPYQADEYTVYMRSPYPLFRTGVNLIFKSNQ